MFEIFCLTAATHPSPEIECPIFIADWGSHPLLMDVGYRICNVM